MIFAGRLVARGHATEAHREIEVADGEISVSVARRVR
jgi:hypothetical protein